MKFVKPDGEFDIPGYKAAIRTLITAQEIIVDNASYPTPSIEKNSHAYRPLGLGYANLGALLMSRGLPYDSDAGRDYAASLTAIMTGEAYAQSAADLARSGRSVPRLRDESRAVLARDAEASRCGEGHHGEEHPGGTSWPRPGRRGTKRCGWESCTATATARPPCWRPRAPSAS
jgi:ribonucleotide reductase alpha subunit